ncbi:MAG: molybdopterin-dependent oxidoreductase [Solirubrobacterales bacterium]|nr:molybdopterin-dependent oxidoreductase [Solirubrobacterales bacterium]
MPRPSGPPHGQIGRRVRRVEDRPLLRGEARFLDDLEPPDTLHVAFVRSVHPHAEIGGVDLSAAGARPDVAAVCGPDRLHGFELTPQLARPGAARVARPVLAGSRARFVGEAIAAVLATSRYAAEDAAEDVEVAYRPMSAVPSIEVALDPASPQLHPEQPNVVFHEERVVGDPDAGFRDAAAVVERTFASPRYNAAPMEGRGALAVPNDDGLVLWSSTQIPHILEESVSSLLGGAGRVTVRCPDIGGGFGQKAHVFPEEIVVAAMALELGRPVKWVEDRVENMLASAHAREQLVRARAAADERGRLLAVEAEISCDVGAYGIFPWGQLLEALGTPAMLPGPYDLRDYRYSTQAVVTNKAPQGAYRGVGLPVATFVHERLLELLAVQLDIDRAQVRRVNLIPSERLPYETVTGLRYDSGDYRGALDMALDAAGYEGFGRRQREARLRGRLIGLGFSSYVEWTGTNSATYKARGMTNVRGYDAGRVSAEPDGTFTVWTSCPAIGQGVATTFAQVVAEHLGVAFESVRTRNVDTGHSPPGSGSFASRSAISAGGALIAAAAKVRDRLLEAAAEALEASVDDLTLEAGRIAVRGSPRASVSLAELVSSAGPGRFDVSDAYDPPHTAYPYATHVCEVAVDPETGDVEILTYVVAEDCGREINPIVVAGQVRGATAQGIGGAVYEAMRFADDGQAATASFMDYLVPTACELPEVEVLHLETPAPDLRGGFKGVGEGGVLAPPAALANAISNALDVEINRLPASPEAIRAAIAAARAPQPA